MAARRAVSQRIHKRIEEAFGWIKMVAGLEQTKFRGGDRVGLQLRRHRLQLTRLPKLLAQSAIGTFLQQPALMFAFKGQRAVFYSAAADCADRWLDKTRRRLLNKLSCAGCVA
jgi:hypothetical protein